MTSNGWFQIAIFLALILAVTKPMGVFWPACSIASGRFMDPVLRPVERLLYRLTGVDEDHEMRWTEYAFAMLLFSAGVDAAALSHAARAGLSAAESAEVRGSVAGAPGVQHGGLVHHQYELAVVFGRVDHELLHPDGRPGLPQLRFRGDRHRAGDRVHSRHCAAADEDHRKFLGRHGALPACGCCCPSALSGRWFWSRRAWCRT